jgi:D-serine dehydratase
MRNPTGKRRVVQRLDTRERALIEPDVTRYVEAYAAFSAARAELERAADRLQRIATTLCDHPGATFDPDHYEYVLPGAE